MRIEPIHLNDEPIAISGMGLACALGRDVEQTWRAVRAGQCGAGPMNALEQPLPEGRDGCQAVPLPDDFEPRLPREARYLRWAILEAMRDAGALEPEPSIDPARSTILLGTTLHGMRAAGRFFRNGDHEELRNFLAGDTIRLATNDLPLHGGAATTCSACSSSLGSIVLGATLLQTGQADLVIAGGYDTISEYVWGGFNALRLVTIGPLRPFTRGRTGMKLGEGYGIVVLERLRDAQARRAPHVHAIVAGWGESADAHHLTQPHPTGDGAHRAMSAAIASANIEPPELGLIAAHATGTPDNDAAEHAALAKLLGDALPNVPVVAFKSHIGHTLGAAGAAELILSAMALRDGIVPACANVDPAMIEFDDLRVTHGPPEPHELKYTLNTSLGFGGANTCVVLRSFDGLSEDAKVELSNGGARHEEGGRDGRYHNASQPQRRVTTRVVVISGVGAIVPGAVGNDAFVRKILSSSPTSWQRTPGAFVESEYEHLLNARRVRRMSPYVKMMLAAATIACRDAKLLDRAELLADAGAVLGTTHGSSSFSYEYYGQIVRDGMLTANPMLFAEGVPNVGAAQLSLMLGLKRACQSIIGNRTAGLDAMRHAWLGIASGAIDRVIVGAAEESHASVERAYEFAGMRSKTPTSSPPFVGEDGFCPSAGSVAFVLETEASARERGASIYASIENIATLHADRDAIAQTVETLLRDRAAAHVISSANATCLDRNELTAFARLPRETTVGCAYDACGEAFAASALLGIAATLLNGEMPAVAQPPAAPNVRWSQRGERIDRFTSLCSDWNGVVTCATLQLHPRHRGLPSAPQTGEISAAEHAR